jgi:hypothetical protein
MVAGAASERSLGSPSKRSVAGWSSPIRLSGLGVDRWTGSSLAVSVGGGAAGAISAGEAAVSAGVGGTGGLRGGFGGCGATASVSVGDPS